MATLSPADTYIDAKTTRTAWSDERKDTLRRLWKAKHTSSEIARHLGGVSRNAVMGMVNRLGLMGTGGSYVVHATLGEAKMLLKEAMDVEYDRRKPGHDEVLIAIAGAMCGRDAASIAHCLRIGRTRIENVLTRFHETGTWLEDAPTPDAWFDDRSGNVAMVMDAMVAAGRVRRVMRGDGEWEYRSPG